MKHEKKLIPKNILLQIIWKKKPSFPLQSALSPANAKILEQKREIDPKLFSLYSRESYHTINKSRS